MAIYTNGTSDRAYRTANLPPVTAFTACAWFYYVSTRASLRALIEFSISSSGYLFLTLESAGNFTIHRSNGSDASTSFGISPEVGVWQFIAMRQLSGTHKGYVWNSSGSLTTASASFTPTFSPDKFSFGCTSFDTSQWPDARFAAIKLWDRGLSDAEVEAERWSILPKAWDSLNEFWPCFAGATEQLAGYSKGRNLTAAGSLADAQGPPVSWGGAPIIIGAAAAQPAYTQTKYQFFNDDGDLAAA